MKSKQDNYIAGIYVRLSKDDERAGESLSIENQKLLLTQYAREQGWVIHDIYADDGISGTTFERPGVQRLLDDAKAGIINLIIVKDLSRFGRNYIEVGKYTDYIFPMFGIRFIALSDNIDTADKDTAAMDMMPIMNVFNEWYASNTSKKIRAVFKAGAQNGKYYSSHAPYGYIIGPTEKRLPIIDEEAAENVREIFRMRARGVSPNRIAEEFNARHILPPEYYRAEKFGTSVRRNGNGIRLWTGTGIRQILHNPTYLGNLVQQKTTSVSYKNKRRIVRDESERIVVENTHEAIIGKELWDKCREMEKSVSRGKPTKRGYVHPLSGLLFCADCGGKMKLSWRHSRKSRKTPDPPLRFSFDCGNRLRYGKSYCASHYINAAELETLVAADIREKAKAVRLNEAEIKREYLERNARMTEETDKAATKKIRKNKLRFAELERLIDVAYEDRAKGKLPEEICIGFIKRYTEEKSALEQETEQMETQLSEEKQARFNVDVFLSRIKNYLETTELTREVCLELIERIYIGELPKDKDIPRKIEIVYKVDIESVLLTNS